MTPVSSAVIDAYYSSAVSSGNVDGYCHITCNLTEIDKQDVFYRILYHEVDADPGVLLFHSDMPWERWFFGVKVKIASLVAGGITSEDPIRLVDEITIRTVNIDDEGDFEDFVIAVPSDLSHVHETPHDFSSVTVGDIGDTHGAVNLRWQDLTKFVSGGRITLSKYGVTSLGEKQILYDQTFVSMPLTFNPDYSAPNFIQITFPTLPPGIPLPSPPVWSSPPPVADRNAPMWVVEGDLLTLTIIVFNNDPSASPETVSNTFNFYYYHKARFYQFTDAATLHQPYRKQLEIIQDPWVPVPIQGTFAAAGWVTPPGPAPGAWSISPEGLLSCDNPTGVGHFTLKVGLTSRGHALSVEPILLAVNIAGLPVIKAPPQTIDLTIGLPFPEAYSLYATNHPTHFSFTGGSLPSGLTLDEDTGEITGVPDTIIDPGVGLTFYATNAVGVSTPGYSTVWRVLSFSPPTITSPLSLAAYLGKITTYQIETDGPALSYRAFGLPDGLVLIGSVITGKTTAIPGIYSVGLQAANKWGWSAVFQLEVLVTYAVPVIYSPLEVETEVSNQFDYDIVATFSPLAYDANPLPPGLLINTATGHITGIPNEQAEYTGDRAIILSAINPGGTGTAALELTVFLPPVPVIDTTAFYGRVLTAEAGVPIGEVSITASHHPTDWHATGIPTGLTFSIVTDERGEKSAKFTGTFLTGGFFGVQLTAENSRGVSLPATLNFLVTYSPSTAQIINQLGTIMEIWINLNSAEVGIGNTSTIEDENPEPPHGLNLTVKRGDSIDLRIIFHEEGVPANVTLSSLKFGIKAAFDDEFIIFTDTYSQAQGGSGRFQITPDFSGTNDDLDSVLVEATTTLRGEVQWEMQDNGVVTRRSSKIFDVIVLRDLIHPD